jgi:molybdate-binding protein/DNA-binding transcriptional regulator YhcF (GntR family)
MIYLLRCKYNIKQVDSQMDLKLDQHSPTPLYKQIKEQVRELIAAEKLKQGDRLPAIRQLARTLNVNQNTVVKAYMELEHEHIVVSRRGGGTIVSTRSDDPNIQLLREQHLFDLVSNSIIEALSQGYSLEELDVTFHLQAARWRELQRSNRESIEHDKKKKKDDDLNIIRISGSHDLALDILVSQVQMLKEDIKIKVTHTGSISGLIALREGSVHLAGIHLLDEETAEYNYTYVKHIFPAEEMVMLHLAYRTQGLMFLRNNPKNIKGLEDLSRRDIIFINRQIGSGTRVLLDLELKRRRIQAEQIRGYENELDSHLAVAMKIAQGEADVGLGIQAAAKSHSLGFLPLFRERFDLVTTADIYESGMISPVLKVISSEEFKQAVNNMGGYDTSETGIVTCVQ